MAAGELLSVIVGAGVVREEMRRNVVAGNVLFMVGRRDSEEHEKDAESLATRRWFYVAM